MKFVEKYDRNKTMWITRKTDGSICWLETGNENAGFNHVLANHKTDFANIGITSEVQISSLVYNLVKNHNPIEIIESSGKHVYSYMGKYIRVVISSNGYIVTAFPESG